MVLLDHTWSPAEGLSEPSIGIHCWSEGKRRCRAKRWSAFGTLFSAEFIRREERPFAVEGDSKDAGEGQGRSILGATPALNTRPVRPLTCITRVERAGIQSV